MEGFVLNCEVQIHPGNGLRGDRCGELVETLDFLPHNNVIYFL